MTSSTLPAAPLPSTSTPHRGHRLALLLRGRPQDPRWVRPALLVLLGGTALLALGSIVSAIAPTFTVFVLAQVPIGVAVAVLVSAGAAAAGEWAEPGRQTRLLSSTLLGPPTAWENDRPTLPSQTRLCGNNPITSSA